MLLRLLGNIQGFVGAIDNFLSLEKSYIENLDFSRFLMTTYIAYVVCTASRRLLRPSFKSCMNLYNNVTFVH